MVEIARTLSQGIPFVRVDLYALNDGSIKFGEMTFTTESGIPPLAPGERQRLHGQPDPPARRRRRPGGGQRVTPAVSVIVPVYKAEATSTPASRASLRRRSRTLSCCSSTTKARPLPGNAMPGQKDPPSALCTRPRPGPVRRAQRWQAAAAPWLTMVDSDDTIAPDLVEKLLAGAETTGAELVICNGCPVTEDGARHPAARRRAVHEGHAAGRRCVLGRLPHAMDQPVHRHGPPPLRRKVFDGVRYPWVCCTRITTCCRI